jgi:hypothetical protein
MSETREPIPSASETYYYPQKGQQTRIRLDLATYEYEAPFKYDNITVIRQYLKSREGHGVELGMVNYDARGSEPQDLAGDRIIISESHPIVRLVVIGSACTPPGYVQIECEPVEDWRDPTEAPGALPVRFRQGGLWGMHLRVDAMMANTQGVERKFGPEGVSGYAPLPEIHGDLYPSMKGKLDCLKSDGWENPLAGMSCAIFEIPPSRKVTIQGGSEIPGWASDNYPGDHHYSFRTIRTTVDTNR